MALTASDVVSELAIDSYLKPDAASMLEESIRTVLTAMEESPTDYRLHVDRVQSFMSRLWDKYDCSSLFSLLTQLTRIEPALLDIERRPEADQRYRDHFVHSFHVFAFGLRLITAIVRSIGDSEAARLLKVTDESLQGRICGYDDNGTKIGFTDYPWKERVFYLWTLMATLHDIAIPISHLDRIRDALTEFCQNFQLEVAGPCLTPRMPADLGDYLNLIGRIYAGHLCAGREEWIYEKPEDGNHYVARYFERQFIRNEHGALGGYLVYKKIEEIFLLGQSKYRLDMDSFQQYRDLILENDIARVALAISLHSQSIDKTHDTPAFMPIGFRDFPLSCILVISDTLQEYLRWEGTSIRGGTKLEAWPSIEVKTSGGNWSVDISFHLPRTSPGRAYFCNQVGTVMRREGRPLRRSGIAQAAQAFAEFCYDELSKRVALGSHLAVTLGFVDNGRPVARAARNCGQ